MKYYVEDSNRRIKMSSQKFVDYCEFEYLARCREVAENIADNVSEKPVVLISGPSGSGKTTTAIIIEHFLQSWGYKAHTISLDNYYRDLSDEQLRLSKIGEFDLETPSRIDDEFLNSQLCDILQCKTVVMPRYNFEISKRENSDWVFTREKNELIIFEGTHALNPNIISISDKQITTCYVSIRSTIENNGTILTSPTIRLARRMLRDFSQRGHSLDQTIAILEKVNNGEEKYIKPYMERCTHSIDTFIPYEINLYKTLLYTELLQYTYSKEIEKLLSVLENADELNPNLIPNTSLIREFIGGSVLKY